MVIQTIYIHNLINDKSVIDSDYILVNKVIDTVLSNAINEDKIVFVLDPEDDIYSPIMEITAGYLGIDVEFRLPNGAYTMDDVVINHYICIKADDYNYYEKRIDSSIHLWERLNKIPVNDTRRVKYVTMLLF